MNCKLKGCLVDLFEEASKTMNFTWSSDYTNDWGLIENRYAEKYSFCQKFHAYEPVNATIFANE